MITAVNKDNSKYYNALYTKANTELGLSGENSIYDLQSYFSKIEELMAIDPKYTILPLDEDYFEIDANSRKITVPQSFRTNGIAVKGDQVAEIVYFRIARYFDFTDLDTTTIFIQWETEDDKDVSGIWVKDIESDPNYLIFGWPLDASITKTAGPIKFSVRFIQRNDDGEITYSFSTLEAQATINPALDLPNSDLVVSEAINQMIANRVKNTEYRGEGPTPVAAIFKVDLNNSTVDLVTADNVDSDDSSYILLVQATSSDAGVINYSWRNYTVADINNITEEDKKKIKESSLLQGDFYYKEIKATEDGKVPVINSGYYTISNGKYLLDDSIKAGEPMPEEKVYEQYGSFKVTQKGQYWAIATNSLGLKNEYTLSSGCAIIPGASQVKYEITENNNRIMQPNSYEATLEYNVIPVAGDTIVYKWYKDNELIPNEIQNVLKIKGDSTYTDVQGNYELRVTTTRNKDSIETIMPAQFVSYLPITPSVVIAAEDGKQGFQQGETLIATCSYEIEDYQKGNKLSYAWYDTLKSEAIYVSENSNRFTPSENLAVLGHQYYCIVTNTYNGQTVSSEKSNQVACVVSE